ncbi:MAG: 50S ribosomal protein L15, partial [bacterium]
MKINDIRVPKGSRKKKKRVGRGESSGHGRQSGRGNKGALARSGTKRLSWFEGGQMPIHRRVPKKGFSNRFRKEWAVVNIWQIANFPA